MDETRCKIGLNPDKKYGYKLTVEGDCTKLLNEVKENLREYGKRYLEDRIIYLKPKANSPEENPPPPQDL
jgi:hypothetical protein